MKRFIIKDIPYYELQSKINRYISNGWNVYRMDNMYSVNRYKIFFTKDMTGEELEKFDEKHK